jgi:hypothetical protein
MSASCFQFGDVDAAVGCFKTLVECRMKVKAVDVSRLALASKKSRQLSISTRDSEMLCVIVALLVAIPVCRGQHAVNRTRKCVGQQYLPS